MDKKLRPVLFSILFVLCLFNIPGVAYAALININTADATLLDTLPGIGPAKATAIVDYRTANGPFAKIEDIQKVSGIGASTYTQLSSLITVGDVPATTTPTSAPPATTTPKITPAVGGSVSNRPPAPLVLQVEIIADTHTYPHVPLELTLWTRTPKGDDDTYASYTWGFGDGSEASGKTVHKSFEFPGTYLVTAFARHGDTVGRGQLLITVAYASVHLTAATADGVTIQNDSNDTLDISDWVLRTADNASFRMPPGTIIAGQASILVPTAITRLFVTGQAVLLYPAGGIAASFPSRMNNVQPAAAEVSSPKEQTIDSAAITSVNRVSHAVEPVAAPAGTTIVVPAGASTTEPTQKVKSDSMFTSPWTLGFLGVLTMAGAALLIL